MIKKAKKLLKLEKIWNKTSKHRKGNFTDKQQIEKMVKKGTPTIYSLLSIYVHNEIKPKISSSCLTKILVRVGALHRQRFGIISLFKCISKNCLVTLYCFDLNENIFIGVSEKLLNKYNVTLEFEHLDFTSVWKYFGELKESVFKNIIKFEGFQKLDYKVYILTKHKSKVKNFFTNMFRKCESKKCIKYILNQASLDLKSKMKIMEVISFYDPHANFINEIRV